AKASANGGTEAAGSVAMTPADGSPGHVICRSGVVAGLVVVAAPYGAIVVGDPVCGAALSSAADGGAMHSSSDTVAAVAAHEVGADVRLLRPQAGQGQGIGSRCQRLAWDQGGIVAVARWAAYGDL